ncbi:MAG: carbamoyl-phosphate synthase (glutamine-hydrolyzing) large subunit, partial [Polyangia bacterium]|nr:carbamoyl-phosphate synthase (glutamine-hydrolyzing) large subunit [Polyangia bacterium]
MKIGEAGEFDYSGSQAIKALKEEGIPVVLVNPNIATIQTSEGLADEVYFLPVTPEHVTRVMEREGVDAIFLSFGGQTALNCGLALADSGALERLGVRVMGTPVETIRDTEDRDLFIKRLAEIGVHTARSEACASPDEVRAAALRIGFPVMLRGAFALGGMGSTICGDEAQLERALLTIFVQVSQVLVEESLAGWKEIEYEVVADSDGNCVTVCNMENLDPMGVHTGESIVVAPSQTLDNHEYHLLREVAIKTIRHLGIVGECNIQYALDPASDRYRVIEVNARLSRSSALASKATGYPLAYVAAKLALGHSLLELPNVVTGSTRAFFEPALDYCVVKVPRWDLEKFSQVTTVIGSSMKSVGEVMAIGRDFVSALQKALRMLQVGVGGLEGETAVFESLEEAIRTPNPYRIFAIANALRRGMGVEAIHALSGIDPWFLHQCARVIDAEARIAEAVGQGGWPLPAELLWELKRLGFSDAQIARLVSAALPGSPSDVTTPTPILTPAQTPPQTTTLSQTPSPTPTVAQTEAEVRAQRHSKGNVPIRRQIDTLAAEYPAQTNYLYLSYDGAEDEAITRSDRRVLVLGSGVYRIGSSVEFDWCSVNAVRAARELGYETILLNHNPETVSTDFDLCDRLVFDEISLETVLDLWDRERPEGVIVSVGGQVSNNLAIHLARAGVRILGTSAESIDRAEDRHKFSCLCDEIGLDQPRWTEYTGEEDLSAIAEELGFPLLVRPSYVLSGAAMRVVWEAARRLCYRGRAALVSPDHPVVITRFETGSKEIEIDAVADHGSLVLWAIAEHIENAGVHSGDATLVIPPQKLYLETVRRIKQATRKLAAALEITGPFNIQFLAKSNRIKIIECNLRASRSAPFLSKAGKVNFVDVATRIMLGHPPPAMESRTLDMDYVAVKAPQFSFSRLTGADPTLGVEMASTGEVACFGEDLYEALLKSLEATGFRRPRPGAGVLLSIGGDEAKEDFLTAAGLLLAEGHPLWATRGTAAFLAARGFAVAEVRKQSEEAPSQTVLGKGPRSHPMAPSP